MGKMMRKLFAFVLVFVLIFTLAACGGGASSSQAAAGGEASAAASAEVGGESAAPAASGDTFKIGAYLPLSGGNASFGTEARDAILMAVDEVNAAGGLNGQQVEFIANDSQSSPEEAVKVVNKMLEVDKINACIGSILSSEVMATGEALNNAQVLTFALGTSPSFMEQDWPYIFRATMNSGIAMGIEAQMMVDMGMSNVACFTSLDESAVATLASFKEECEKAGIEIVASESHDAGDTDYSAQIANILAADPQCVWFATDGQVTPVFVKQLRQYGYTGIIMDKEAFATSMVEIAGVDASTHIMFANPYVTYGSIDECDIPEMKAFLEKYEAKYGGLPQTECGYRGYDSFMCIVEAAKIAGSNEPEALREAANQINMPALGGTLDFTQGDREGYHVFNTFMMVDGKSVLLSDWMADGGYDAYKEETGNEF